MLNIAVLVSGGGTNLQALLDSEARGENPNGKITLVVASKPGVYALERAAKAGVESCVVRRRDYDNSEEFDAALLGTLKAHNIDLVVLAGFLSVLGPSVIAAYPRRILNVHPALIPSFCGPGMYGLRPHEAALARGCKVTGATVHFVNEECDGLPKNIVVHSEDVRAALLECLEKITSAIKETLERTPPELSADIIDRGITLTGGGALLRGLDQLIQSETGIDVHVAEDPLDCVAKGAGAVLDHVDVLHDVLDTDGGHM